MELPIKLRKEKHAIKEAVITLFLSAPIIKPDRFKELIKDKDLSGFFHQFQSVGEVTINFEGSSKGIFSNQEPILNRDAGFKLLRFDEGKPEFVLQGVNSDTRNYFSFHELNYKRWADFIGSYQKLIGSLEKIQTETFLTGVSLNYVDEFVWIEEGPIDLSRIIVAKEYLPENFIKIKSGHLVNTREVDGIDGNKLLDRIEVKLSTNISKTVTISHNQSLLFTGQDLFELKSPESKAKMVANLNVLHENNKKFLKAILLQEVKQLIGLE